MRFSINRLTLVSTLIMLSFAGTLARGQGTSASLLMENRIDKPPRN